MELQNKKYTVIVSKRATRMLVSHASFLARTSEKTALRLTESFVFAANSFETMPQSCPFLNSDYIPKSKYRKLIFEEKYIIIYQIIDDKVYLNYIVDSRQNYSWLLK